MRAAEHAIVQRQHDDQHQTRHQQGDLQAGEQILQPAQLLHVAGGHIASGIVCRPRQFRHRRGEVTEHARQFERDARFAGVIDQFVACLHRGAQLG